MWILHGMAYIRFFKRQPNKALGQCEADWKAKYPIITEQWRRHWDHLFTMFNFRHAVYTTNAIELVNSVIRKATPLHKMFQSM